MANVHLRNGNIFDNASDLVLLPCSAKGTISKFAEQHVKNYNLERPEPMPLGEMKIHPFTGSGTITKYYAWCASVLNDSSSPEAIESIGRRVGEFTRTNSKARSVEAPILGTGAGGLSPEPAATALATGFRNSAHENATLVIFSPYREIVDALQNKIEADFAREPSQAATPGTKFTKETPEGGRARIVNYAGIWKGEFRGTNRGTLVLQVQQDGDVVSGAAKFDEPARGPFDYSVKGVAGTELSFDCNPTSNPRKLNLGRIKGVASIQEDGQLVGRWKSTNGMEGTFATRRELADVVLTASPPKQGTTKTSGHEADRTASSSQTSREIWLYAQPRDEREREGVEEMQEAFLNERFVIGQLLKEDFGDLDARLSQPDKQHIFPVVVLDARRLAPVLVSPLRGLIEKRRVFLVVVGNENDAAEFYAKHSVPTSLRCGAWNLLGALATAITAYIRNPSIDVARVAEQTQSGRTRVVAPSFDPATALTNQLPAITNDGVDGTPHIDISADVESIARVICMKQITPPLSIALFGNWGSGKSFFMRQVQKRVATITGRVDPTVVDSPFYGQVAQIEFNAWHYVESDLWASLVSHVFDHLKTSSKHDQDDWQQKRDNLLAKLGVTKQAKEQAIKALAEARALETEAQQKLIISQNEAQNKELALQRIEAKDFLKAAEVPQQLRDQAQEIQKLLGLHHAIHSAKDVENVIREARDVGGRIASFSRTFVHAPGFTKRLLFIVSALATPLVIPAAFYLAALISQRPEWNGAVKWVTAPIGAIALLVPVFRETLRNVRNALTKLEQADAGFETLLQEKLRDKQDAVAQAKGRVNVAGAAVETARRNLDAADASVIAAKKALEDISPRRVLNAFIEERSASDDYRKKLGMLALVQRDFKELSRLMKEVQKEPAANKELPHIDRIILYVDDLDRCPPKQVVEVLQAIHLLLAFELFVVIVGVDPRWVSHSLKIHYPELLGDDPFNHKKNGLVRAAETTEKAEARKEDSSTSDGKARPLDYLEKIFQIPFWINPISTPSIGNLIHGILGPGSSSSLIQSESQEIKRNIEEDQGARTERAENQKEVAAEKEPVGEQEFADIALTSDEIQFMKKLPALAGSTPRAVKRYINIYRLLRARVPKDRLSQFLGNAGEPREYEAVMLLVGIYNVDATLARAVGRALEAESNVEGVETIVLLSELLSRFKSKNTIDEAQTPFFDAFTDYCEEFEDTPKKPTIEPFCRWYPVVSRYSFCGELIV